MTLARTAQFVGVFSLCMSGCAQTGERPIGERYAPPGPPRILIRTERGLVPEESLSPEERARLTHGASDGFVYPSDSEPGFNRVPENAPEALRLRATRPVEVGRPHVEQMGPITPQYYYTRGEHTPQGYVPGHYRREGDYIRGEWTPQGYVPGSYRGSGNYVRPEYTPRGYVPGHYRSEPLPFGYPPGRTTANPPR